MGLKLHHVKALPQVDEWVFDNKNSEELYCVTSFGLKTEVDEIQRDKNYAEHKLVGWLAVFLHIQTILKKYLVEKYSLDSMYRSMSVQCPRYCLETEKLKINISMLLVGV